MKIALTTDHAGFERLKLLQKFLEEQGYECINYGPATYVETDDYPDLIIPAAKAVARGDYEAGIIMGGSGQGEAMTANRIKGVRCMVYYGPATAVEAIEAEGSPSQDQYDILRLSRSHNHANILSLAARFLTQADMENAVSLWLSTPFGNAERHMRRVNKIDEAI
jgi:ribose 5-phosphate isomerase B